MKKWLVGLLAAGLCAATALADGVATLPVAENYTSTQDWTALTGFSGSGVGTYSDGRCKFDSNKDWLMVQFDGAPAELTFDVKGNATTSGTEPASFLVEESADAETWSQVANLDETAFSTDYASFGPFALSAESRYVRWTYANKYGFNLGLNNVAIGSDGPVAFALSLDPSEDFTVVQGKSATITANVRGAQGDVTYSWSVNGTPIDLAGNVYTVDSAELGEYEVAVEVSDGVADPLSASVKYTVVEAPVVSGDVLTRETTGVSGTSYKDWTATGDSGAEYAGNSAGGNDSIQMRTTNPSGIVITKSSGKDVASVTVEWNDATAAEKRSLEIYGSTEAYAGPAALYEASTKGELLGTIARDGATLEIPEGYPYVGVLAKGGAVYLTSVAFEFAGEAGLSVTFDKANGFTVDLGTSDSIRATAKNGVEPYTYAWTSDTPELNGSGETLAIPDTLEANDYSVKVTVTDSAEPPTEKEKTIEFSVVAPAVKYAITVDGDIANGSIAADKTEAEEDELVTLTATPAGGYKLGTYLLDGEAISGNTFNMPAKDVLVSATFVEKPVVAGFTKITSLDELTEGEYVLVGSDTNGAYGAVAELTGSTKVLSAAAVTIEDDTVVDAEESQIWTLAQVEGGWTIYNEALGFLGYSGSQNSAMAEAEASEKSTWTFSVADGELFKVANVGTEGRTLRYNYNKGNMRFACYTSDTLPNIGLYKGSSGPAVPSVSLSASATEVEVGETVTITATAKNFSAEPEWSWTGKGTADGATFTVDTSAADVIKVTATATAGEETASKSVTITVSEPAVKYAVNVDGDIANGSVSADKDQAEADELVTLTASPAAGYKLGTYLLDGEPISGNSFNMPTHDVLVSASFIEKPVVAGFTKITSLDDLTEGEYVITGAKAEGEEYAMKAEVSTTSTAYLMRRDEAVTIEEDTVTDADEEIIWTLAQGENGWTIYNAAVGYAGYVKSGNSSGAEAEPSTKSSWTISESETAGLFMLNNVDKDGRYLLYNASSPRFACYTNVNSGKALAFYKGESGPAKFSVKLDPAKYFEVEVGAEAAITATPKNAEGDVTYSWSIGGTPVDATGAVLTLDTSVPTEELEVVCTATDGAGAEATASVSYKVVEPAAKYPITVERVPGGTLSVDKDEAEAGETVTVTATPDPGMKLESITFNGTPISGKTFTMPAEAVTVSGTFVERTGVVYKLVESADDFEAGAEYVVVAYSKDKFTSALKNEASGTRIGVEEVEITDENTVVVDSDAIVWTIQAGASEGQYVLFNATAGVYAAGPKSEGNNAQLLEDGADALAQWTLDFSDLPKVAIGSVAYPERQLNRNSTATYEYFATYKGSGTQPYLFKRAGAPAPAVSHSGSTEITLGDAFSIQFTLKNYDGTYSWDVQGNGSISEAGLYTYKPEAAGSVVIMVKALDGDGGVIAQSEDIQLTVNEPGPGAPKVTCDLGTEVSGSAGQEFTFVFTAEKFTPVDAWVVSVDGEDVQENYDPGQSETFVWTPAAAGTYTIVATTYSDSGEFTCTVTATIGGEPGPGGDGALITAIQVDVKNSKVILTTDGSTVKSTASLLEPNWQPCATTAEGEGKLSVPLAGTGAFFFKAEK